MCHSVQVNKSPRLSAEERKAIAFESINFSNVTEIAKNNQVSRNTVYAQKRKAYQAIDDEFDQSEIKNVQFNLPVTTLLIEQIVLALALICKSSYRDIKQFMKDIFDDSISIGSVFNILNLPQKRFKLTKDMTDRQLCSLVNLSERAITFRQPYAQ